MQGTWCDGLIVQAVANALGITLHIIESYQNFTERTIIEAAVTLQGEQRSLYLGHINEVHYVSTVPDVPELLRTEITNSCSTSIHESKSSSAIEYHKNYYFRTYMRKRRANENDECREKQISKQHKYKQQRRSLQRKSTAKELANPKTHKKRNANKNSDCGEKRLSKQCKYTQQWQTEQRKTTEEGLAQPKDKQRFIAAKNEHTPDALPQSKNLQQRVFAEKNDTEERLHEWSDYEQRLPLTFFAFLTFMNLVHFFSSYVF